MSSSFPIEQQLDLFRRELGLLEPAYEAAMQREKGEDQEWETRKRVMIRRLCELVQKYKIGDEPHKAVAIVAEAGVLAGELQAPARIIDQYREKKQQIAMLQHQAELREKAREAAESHEWNRQPVRRHA